MIQNPSLGCEKSDLTCWQKNLSVRPSNRKVFFLDDVSFFMGEDI